jgi:hypothetical protein
MSDLKEQCICIKFCFIQEKTASKMHEMLKTAFGDNDMGRTQTLKWFPSFKCGKASVEDCEHSGHPCRGHTDKNMVNGCKIIYQDP